MRPDYPSTLDPAFPLVGFALACSLAVWALLLVWALRTGHFAAAGEAVKLRVFEDEVDHDARG